MSFSNCSSIPSAHCVKLTATFFCLEVEQGPFRLMQNEDMVIVHDMPQ